MKKELTIRIPTTLNDITLRQYQDYLRIYDKWDKEDEVYLKTKVLQIFCELSIEDSLNIPVVEFDEIVLHVLNLLRETPELERRFIMEGKDKHGEDVKIEFGFIPKLDDMSYGEFMDLENYINDWQEMHKAMAVLYRPIIQSKKKFYLIDEYKGTKEFADVMLDMPLGVALSANLFFYRLGNKLPILTLDYLEKVMKEEEIPQQLKQVLGENGDGITQYTHLLRAMLQESIKSQEKMSTSVL